MIQFLLVGSGVYLIDTSSLVELDNKHLVLPGQPARLPSFSVLEQALIWDGLENLAKNGRGKLIRQVKAELERWNPDALNRLKIYPGHRAPNRTPDLVGIYQNVMSQFPRLIERYPKYDPADPWIIAMARKYGYAVVTEETPAAEKAKSPRKTPIPDVCQALGMTCLNLRGLAELEEWIPKRVS